MFGTLWTILTLPIRIIVWVVDFLARGTGLAVGFALMVLGVVVGAGPLWFLGVPIFIVGLIVTLKSLG